ncbi:MAG TPA: inorganic phosphate transporter [Nitrososphaerales archaeon]|nr:inorganic phosphate transporter [Nitrososphaerales archaeon]
MDSYLVGLAVLLAFLFGWNNGSFLFGNLRGSGAASARSALGISVLGLALGVILEGPKMYAGMAGTLAPTSTEGVLLATLLTAVVFTLVLTLLSLPVSISMVMVAAFLGASFSVSIPINVERSALVVAFWFVAPLATAALTFVAYTWTSKYMAKFGLLLVDSFTRAGSVFSALLVSYTLGANNVGLILGGTGVAGVFPQGAEVLAAVTLAAVAGTAVSTRSGVSGTIGDRMLSLSPQGVFTAFLASSVLVWVGTQLAIPVSITQCLLGGMLGAAYTKNIAVLNRGLTAETVAVWIVVPVLAFLVGFVLVLA